MDPCAKDVHPVRELKSKAKNYEEWRRGSFVPIKSQLRSLKSLGFKFPDGVKVKKSKKEKTGPSNRFNPDDFPDFTPGRK